MHWESAWQECIEHVLSGEGESLQGSGPVGLGAGGRMCVNILIKELDRLVSGLFL